MKIVSTKTREEFIATTAALITVTHYDYMKAVTVAELLAKKLEEEGHAPWVLELHNEKN